MRACDDRGFEEGTTITDENATTHAADELREYADRVATLADELARIEQVSTADEIRYQLREGEVAIVELTYRLAGDD